MKIAFKKLLPFFFLMALVYSANSYAALSGSGIMDNVLDRYSFAATSWAATITAHATRMFWTLVIISMCWTFGMMSMRTADLGEFFAEFVRFTIFTGFFWWLLVNGPNFATSIMNSLREIAFEASGNRAALSPSGIVDIGFDIFYKMVNSSSLLSPVDSVAGLIISIVILINFALIGVNMLLLLISGWMLAYAGIFFLGFGGSRWTSDFAISYYRTILNIAAQLFAMVLLVGIGKSFVDLYYLNMSTQLSLKELSVMLIVSVILLALVNKIPSLIGQLAVGGGTGSLGSGFGASAAMSAAAIGASAGAAAASAAVGSAYSAAGGTSALMAAASKSYNESGFNSAMGDRSVVSPDGMTRTDATGTWPNAEGIYKKIYADQAKAQQSKSGSSTGGGNKTSSGSAPGGAPTPSTSSGSSTKNSSTASASSMTSTPAGAGSQQSASSGGEAGSISAATSSYPNSNSTTTSGGQADSSNEESASGGAQSESVSGATSEASSIAGNDGEADPVGADASGTDTSSNTESEQQSSSDTRGNNNQPGSGNADKKARSTASTAKEVAMNAGRLVAGTATNLAQGTYDVGSAKFGEIKENARNRISETTGGKIAAAIQRREKARKHNEAVRARYISSVPADNVDNNTMTREEEIAAFRDKYMSEELDDDEPA